MAQVRGTFAELYDNVDKLVLGVIGTNLRELEYPWRSFWNIISSTKKFERIIGVTGFADVPEKPEGEVYSLDVIRPGYSKDFTHLEFGLGFEATETALEDDQYDQLERAAQWLAFAARYVEASKAAAVFNNGFGTETTADTLSVFNTAHTLKGGGTFRNRLATDADLSATSLRDALIDMSTQTKVESGQLIMPPQSLILYVPPDLEFTADRLVNTTRGMPGTADNDRNALRERRTWKIIVDPLLTDTDAWFLIAANKKEHFARSYTRIPITLVPPMTAYDTGNRVYKIRFRRSWGVWDPRGMYGTSGA